MAKKQKSIEYDPKAGRTAFEQLEGALRELGEGQLTPSTARIGLATAFVLNAVRELDQDRAVIESMPGVDEQLVADLEPAAWAAWYAQTEWEDSRAVKTGIKVPEAVSAPAFERRARMLRVLEYHLGDQPRVARRLESIREGSGYDDLASDLARLARLYTRYAPDLPKSDKWYDPDDAALANDDVKAIMQELSSSSSDEWADLRRRAWSYLLRCYGEVNAAVQWLYRDDPETANRFPSLYTVARPGSGRRKKTSIPPPEPEQEAVVDA